MNISKFEYLITYFLCKSTQNASKFECVIILFHLRNGYFIMYIQDQSKSSTILLTTLIIKKEKVHKTLIYFL